MSISDWFCNIYSSIKNNNRFLVRIRFYSLLRVLTRLTANLLLPVYFRLTKNNKQYRLTSDKQKVIVSFTSFPARIDKVWLVVECMLRQTRKPDKIVLWLSKEQFPTMESVPTRLRQQIARGLDIQLREADLRSHKKYYYALKEYPEASFITIDDDVFYSTHTLEHLLTSAEQHQHCVIANTARQVTFDNNGDQLPYTQWTEYVPENSEEEYLFQIGIGGVLYPPHSMLTEAADIQTAMQCCPNGDDIWLYAMCRLNNTRIVKSASCDYPLPIYNNRAFSLSHTNLTGGNDEQIEQLKQVCINRFKQDPFHKQ